MVPGATCKVQTESFPDQIQNIQRSCSYMYSKNKTDHNSNIINTQTHKLTRQDKEHKARQRRQKLSILGKLLQDCSAHPLTTMSCFFKQACMNILSQYGSNMAQIEETHSEKQWTKQTKILGKSSPLGKNQEFGSKISMAILQTIP